MRRSIRLQRVLMSHYKDNVNIFHEFVFENRRIRSSYERSSNFNEHIACIYRLETERESAIPPDVIY